MASRVLVKLISVPSDDHAGSISLASVWVMLVASSVPGSVLAGLCARPDEHDFAVE